jgi:gamma-glutamyltranspeptidase / glutathione hydrolase
VGEILATDGKEGMKQEREYLAQRRKGAKRRKAFLFLGKEFSSSSISLLRLCARTFLLVLVLQPAWAADKPPAYAVASAHPQATEAGMLVLAAGGNAFDAAVAVSAALAVVEPTGSGLGGGGFWLLHRAKDNFQVMVDGRERAPLNARRDMYLDDKGEVIPGLSRDGALAAGIPGEPAALAHIAERYGQLPLARSLAPAIRLAREGFVVDEKLQHAIEYRRKALETSAAAAVFLPQGKPLVAGDVLVQADLARTLTRIAEKGADGFYRGDTADDLLDGVEAGGGIWSKKDLRSYQVVERKPMVLEYRDLRIVTAGPPSSGGVVMGIVFNILSGYDWPSLAIADRRHLTIEAMRRAYRDRAEYLGDPDFAPLPAPLLSRSYADGLRTGIDRHKATPSSSLESSVAARSSEGTNTTHFSVIDAEGNRVAATLSINLPLGSGFMPARTGVLLNNEMDDFSIKPNTPNAYGLVGGEANAVAPGKRMLSSMSPSFIETPERVAIVGTPGGSRIISMVLGAVLAFAEGAGAEALVTQPRLHHQYLPDEVMHEVGALSEIEQKTLKNRGHTLREVEAYGNLQAVIWDRGRNRVEAASDPRGIGLARIQAVATVNPQALPAPPK